MTHRLLAVFAFAYTVAGSAAAADLLVGPSADPGNWTFIGVHSYAPAHVQWRLENDFELQAAADPRAPLFDFLTKLQQRLEQGYRYCGFVDATAQVEPNLSTGDVTITVAEGPRYRAGEVICDAVPDEISRQIRHCLTEKHIADPDAIPTYTDEGKLLRWVNSADDEVAPTDGLWKRGEPVRWDFRRQMFMRKEAQQALADFGYPQADFALELNRLAETADLRVRIDNLGPPAEIQQIFVLGSGTHSADDVCHFLQLEPGTILTRTRRHEIRKKLLDCGRFAEVQLVTEQRFSGLTLRIEVKDTPNATHLNEPLSDTAAALLRLRQWLIREIGQGKDLVVEWPRHPHEPQLILSQDGVLCTFSRQGSPVHAIDISTNAVRLHDVTHAIRLETTRRHYSATISIGLSASADEPEKRTATTHYFAYRKADDDASDGGPLLRVHTHFAPSYFFALACDPAGIVTRQGNELQIRSGSTEITIDEATGELLSCIIHEENGQIGTKAYVAAGQRQARIAELAETMAGIPVQDAPQYPVTQYAEFFLDGTLPFLLTDDLLASLENDEKAISRGIELARQLIHCGALRPVDLWVTRPEQKTTDDPFDFRLTPSTGMPMDEDLLKSALSVSNYLFETDTWPWILLRQAAFLRSGHGEYAIPLINATTHTEQCGPVGHWLAAELLAAQHPKLAGEIALNGQQVLDTANFRQDCALLIPERIDVYLPFLRHFSHLAPEETQQMARRWPRYGEFFAELAKIGDAEAPEAETVAALLDLMARQWEQQLRDQLAARLEQLAKLHVPTSKANLFDADVWKTAEESDAAQQDGENAE